MRHITFVRDLIRKNPGFVVLFIILTIISASTIRPEFYFAGWDNYSSYFQLPINLFRTLFGTWRAYRGLGVASDAEVTDLFRQLTYWVLHAVFSERLLDQVYYQGALWAGVMGMYLLAREVVQFLYMPPLVRNRRVDLYATLAASLYLCNLNTLSVFYSPMIPFTIRFFALPVSLWLFLRFVRTGNRQYMPILALFIIYSSGMNLTPTVFITTTIAYAFVVLTLVSFKRAVVFMIGFIALNAFWLLPFANYTIEKSSIIPLARTFIEINESVLNANPAEFSAEKQLILSPSFFNMQFTRISDGQPFPIHPLLKEYTTSPLMYGLYLFPVLAGIGLLLIIRHSGFHARLLWIPSWFLVFLFLSFKEFGPFGFVYSWLNTVVPLFGIVFRISDTKFHAYVSLAGALAGAYALLYAMSLGEGKRWKHVVSVTLLLLIFSYGMLFRGYIGGNLTGFFTYTDIPDAYRTIAARINGSPGNGRVLHLPMDSWHSYWRSFSWGYVGSAFLNFSLAKPYIDKTFEPASMENAYLHARITALLSAFYYSNNAVQKEQLAAQWVQLMRSAGVAFIIVDESVTSSITARDMLFSAKLQYVQSKALFSYLEQEKFVEKVHTETIPLGRFRELYSSLYPFPNRLPAESSSQAPSVTLYRFTDPTPAVRMISESTNIDPSLDNALETNWNSLDSHITQDSRQDAQLIPFMTQRHTLIKSGNALALAYANPNERPLPYELYIPVGQQNSYLIDVYGTVVGRSIELSFRHRNAPDINGQKFTEPIGSVLLNFPGVSRTEQPATVLAYGTVLPSETVADSVRLQLNDVVIPVPSDMSKPDTFIGSYMLHEQIIRTSILTKQAVVPLDPVSLSKQVTPACLGSMEKTYTGQVQPTASGVRFRVGNGSVCSQSVLPFPPGVGNIPLYAEMEFGVRSGSQVSDVTPRPGLSADTFLQQLVQKTKPIASAYVCVRQEGISECMNPSRHFRTESAGNRLRIALRTFVSPLTSYPLVVGGVSYEPGQESVEFSDMKVHYYRKADERTLTFTPRAVTEHIEIAGPITITFPKAASAYSAFHEPDVEMVSTTFDACKDRSEARVVRFVGNTMVYGMKNCTMHGIRELLYAPDRPYLVSMEYWLGSGQQPVLVIGKDKDDYFMERISLYQGYPNISAMKQLQNLPGLSSRTTSGLLDSIPLTSASRFIDPLFFSDTAPAETSVHFFQDTANMGVTALRSLDVVEYPAAWRQLTLTPQRAKNSYQLPDAPLVAKQLLPSLWEVKGITEGSMVLFDNAYDRQWALYGSLPDLLIGRKLASPVRCDGFANCFRVPEGISRGVGYIFYTPEKLSFIGWGITLAMFVLSVVFAKRSFRSS